jgi:hypothetical protein
MTIERNHEGVIISDIVNGQRVKQFYIGYRLTEAKKIFKTYIKGL